MTEAHTEAGRGGGGGGGGSDCESGWLRSFASKSRKSRRSCRFLQARDSPPARHYPHPQASVLTHKHTNTARPRLLYTVAQHYPVASQCSAVLTRSRPAAAAVRQHRTALTDAMYATRAPLLRDLIRCSAARDSNTIGASPARPRPIPPVGAAETSAAEILMWHRLEPEALRLARLLFHGWR